ncbi:cell division protein FtsQ/DivIB [Candidatus Paracaedibacter symbiosus]|uniref:cell division protein FtsQ/DivIB n=1 Tax=Candidatus Paracaedibacter symbiosus TaxID=244582 RepID=UPI000509B6A2|nr:cell division protein FtsQ/DivIB [Candidatus Paracaedibacter symbiosus]
MQQNVKKKKPIIRKPRNNHVSIGERFISLFDRSSNRSRRTIFKTKTLYTGVALCVAGLLGVIWYQEYPQKALDGLYQASLDASAKFGFKVNDIQVQGRQYTSGQRILQAMQLKVNDPIFKLSPHEICQNLKEVSWIKEAHVHRHLPGTIYVKIIERVPIAIWQHQKTHYLVDAEGVIITNENLSHFMNLPVIVGGDAPLHVPKILAILEKFPEVRGKITALVRVGGRRWDIQLNRQVTIKLPESKTADAVAKLDTLLKHQRLDLEEVKTVDLRLPNKMIMNLSPRGEVRLKAKGSET